MLPFISFNLGQGTIAEDRYGSRAAPKAGRQQRAVKFDADVVLARIQSIAVRRKDDQRRAIDQSHFHRPARPLPNIYASYAPSGDAMVHLVFAPAHPRQRLARGAINQ